MYKIRTYNAIALKGLERFGRQSYEVGSDIGHPDAFLLRSQKLHDVAVPDSLLAVARGLALFFGAFTLLNVAGALRTPLAPFVVLVAIGKTARYAVLVAATLGWLA